MKVVDPVKYRRIYEDVMKKLDKLENEFLPQVSYYKLGAFGFGLQTLRYKLLELKRT